MLSFYKDPEQDGINIVDLMMWLVIAALLLATAIQGIGYYQKAATLEILKSDADGFGANALAAAAGGQGRLTLDVVEDGADNTQWSDGVNHQVIAPEGNGKPYLVVESNAVDDLSVVYMFDACGSLNVGVNVIPKGDTSAFGPCLTDSSVPPPPAKITTVAGWGLGTVGQMGNGTTVTSNIPVNPDTSGVLFGKTIQGESGADNSCVIADAAAYCWGAGNFGGLGNGASAHSSIPVAVSTTGVLSGKTVTKVVSGGTNNACAVADSKLYCWGYNGNGQLGNGNTTTSNVPVEVNMSGVLAGKTITSISMGQYNTCVVASGLPYCWGQNAWGQLGNGTWTSSSVPVAVRTSGALSGKTITDISVASRSVCAIADGSTYCWGQNNYGQLGNGTLTDSSVPVAVTTTGVLAGKTVTGVSSGIQFVCVIASGAPYCWGHNGQGQLGNGSQVNSSSPVAVDASGVLSGKVTSMIDSTANSTCVATSYEAYCWGANAHGQIGNGTNIDALSPATVFSSLFFGKTIDSISGAGNNFLVKYTG